MDFKVSVFLTILMKTQTLKMCSQNVTVVCTNVHSAGGHQMIILRFKLNFEQVAYYNE